MKLAVLLAVSAKANVRFDKLLQHYIPHLGVKLIGKIRGVSESVALVYLTVMHDRIVVAEMTIKP
jgi:hypothetical protein